MPSPLKGRAPFLLVLSVVALFLFFRTPGADAVRWVQILLLFVAGACTGMALAFIRKP